MTCLEDQSPREDGDLLSKTLLYGNSAASLVMLPAYNHIRTEIYQYSQDVCVCVCVLTTEVQHYYCEITI